MKNRALPIFFLFFLPPLLSGSHSIGDYRTAASGNWSSASTWEMYNGFGWIPAPASNVRNRHTVTDTANTLVDELTINAGGTLLLASSTLTPDMLGIENLYCNESLQMNGGDLNMNSGGIFARTSTGTITFDVTVTSTPGTFKGVGTYDFNNLFLKAGTIAPGLSPGIVLVT